MSLIERWGPQTCPTCGAEPYVYCQTASKKRAGNIHRDRFPEDARPAPKAYGKRRERQQEARVARAERAAEKGVSGRRKLPLDLALKDIEAGRMAVFRERRAA